MKNKDVYFDHHARENLLKGASALNDAVKSTLGPAGRIVIIEDEFEGLPKPTKDGVTVAKSIKFSDPLKNMGAQLVREAASQTAEEAGDGTTTATVLAHAMISKGYKTMNSGANPIDVKKGMELALKDIVTELKNISKEIKDPIEIEQVGTISSNNDESIGKLIASAMDQVGVEGVITVEEAKRNETSLEVVEGLQFNKGYLSPYFINDNANMQVQLENCYVLVYGAKLNDANKAFISLLEKIIHAQKPLLIVADDVDGPALATLIVNKARGNMAVCAVKAPEFGDRKRAIMEDIAILTGGTVITPDKGMTLDKVLLEKPENYNPILNPVLGKARMITVNNKQTTIIDGFGDVLEIEKRVEEIKISIDKAQSDFDREKLQERLAKLAGGVAILNIGAETESELKEKKDRVEDALNATKAAVEEGIVPGGGLALMNIANMIFPIKPINYNDDQQIGYNIVMTSIREPFNAIMSNAGLNGDAIWEKILNSRKEHLLIDKVMVSYDNNDNLNSPPNTSLILKDVSNIGFNARTEQICDLIASGIVDPTKVTRIALEKAVSVAGMFLTTNCVITNVEEKDKQENMNNNYMENM